MQMSQSAPCLIDARWGIAADSGRVETIVALSGLPMSAARAFRTPRSRRQKRKFWPTATGIPSRADSRATRTASSSDSENGFSTSTGIPRCKQASVWPECSQGGDATIAASAPPMRKPSSIDDQVGSPDRSAASRANGSVSIAPATTTSRLRRQASCH